MSAATPKLVFIVLFRGVGGPTQLPTAPLRKALGDAGFGNVSTYINSGNAVLSSGHAATETHARIADIAKADFGFEKEIMLVSRPDLERLIDENPFPEAVDQPTTLHAFVLQKVPAQSAVEALTGRLAPHEHLVVKGNFLYLHVPTGSARRNCRRSSTACSVPCRRRETGEPFSRSASWPPKKGRAGYQLPVFGMEAQGSAFALAGPFCSSSMEMPSGVLMKAILPSRGGRLIVTPLSIRFWQVA